MAIPGGSLNPEVRPSPEVPEAGVEVSQETAAPQPKERVLVDRSASEIAPVAAAYQAVAPVAQVTKDPTLKRVEEILEDDLADTYFSLPENKRAAFKKRGEDIAAAIQKMVQSAKVKAKDVVKMIVAWLRMIPHVNRFFLEQEAKIKTDQLIAFAEREKETRL